MTVSSRFNKTENKSFLFHTDGECHTPNNHRFHGGLPLATGLSSCHQPAAHLHRSITAAISRARSGSQPKCFINSTMSSWPLCSPRRPQLQKTKITEQGPLLSNLYVAVELRHAAPVVQTKPSNATGPTLPSDLESYPQSATCLPLQQTANKQLGCDEEDL